MNNLAINKILVAIDFSDNSIIAFQTAVRIAKAQQARLKLFHVFDVDNNLYPESHTHNSYKHPGDLIRALEELASTARSGHGIVCDIDYMNGHVTTSILQTVIANGTDFIVMGKNGHSGDRKMYAGSHAYDVVKKAHCPVLVVPGSKVHEKFTNILFPVRPVMSVLEKYNMVRPILIKSKASLHLMGMRDPVVANEVHIISKLMNLLKQNADEDKVDTKMTYYFNDEKFAEHVLKTVAESGYEFEMVVITAELDDSIREFYIGDYAQQIIHRSIAPVLVIRPTSSPLPKDDLLRVLENGTSVFA